MKHATRKKELIAVIFPILISTGIINAQQFRVARPTDDIYQIHGGYLYAETNFGYPHKGVDYQTPLSTPIYSAADGFLYWKDYEPEGAGYYVMVQSRWSGQDIWFMYFHLSDNNFFNLDDTIHTGDQIGLSGNTGNSTGPHMHFEIRQNDVAYDGFMNRRNPELWTAIQGMGAIYGRVPNALDGTRVDISPDPKPRPPYTTYSYSLTYTFDGLIGNDDVYQENYAIGDVKPGTYTITSVYGYSRVVTVAAGQVVDADASTEITVEETAPPADFVTVYNYPNPFNAQTTIAFTLVTAAEVQIYLYDMSGRKADNFFLPDCQPGHHQIIWNAERQATGVYLLLLRATAGNRIETKSLKITLIR
jgi:murein DD-endopeptidase MepM/ murein hydrolase activator NlpD